MKKLFVIAVMALGILQVQAQGDNKEFSVDVQLRPRAEVRDGQGQLAEKGAQSAAFISNRARLGLGYKSAWLDLRVAGQHVGTWGAEGQQKTGGDFTMNEAWAKLHSNNGVLYLQAGRQSLSYDDQRILGGLDWAQTGRYHDGLKLGVNTKENKLDVILAWNQNSEKKTNTYFDATAGQPYKAMQTVWYHHQFTDARFGMSLLFMNVGWEIGDAEAQTKGKTTYMQTFGTYLTYNPGTWNFSGSFYYQTGKNSSDKKVGAYTWSLTAADKVCDAVTVNAGVDFRSGDDGTSATNHTFDQLYGTHHKFYGYMDYFMQKVGKGIWDPRVGATFKLAKPVSLEATYHHFLADKKVNDKKYYGSEVDLQLTWKLMKDVGLQAGFSTMFAGDALKTPGVEYKGWQKWGWLSLNVNPTVFSTKRHK